MQWLSALFLSSLLFSYPAHAQNEKMPVIVIDPGHGGIDGGTQSEDGAVLEKDLNLQIAKKLAERLKKDGLQVEMTRETDEDVTKYAPEDRGWGRHKRDLYGRVDFAEQKNATLILSIHGNHGTSSSRGGMILYNKNSGESFLLASELQSRFNRMAGTSRSPETGRLYILRKPDIPSVIVEYGYLSNPNELKKLTDPTYQDQIVDTIVGGLYSFFILYDFPHS